MTKVKGQPSSRAFQIEGKSKVVTIGGGGGHAGVLRALKDLPIQITALTNVVDNGGGSGRLMQDYGVHHPGELRQVFGALAPKNGELLSHRFNTGQFEDQTLGNLMIAGLECATGSIEQAVGILRQWLTVDACVSPLTLEQVTLHATSQSGKHLVGQRAIAVHVREHPEDGYTRLWVDKPQAQLSPVATTAIKDADHIIVCMGDLYSSVAPSFCFETFTAALEESHATLVWLPNVVAADGHYQYATIQTALKFFQSLSSAFQPDVIILDTSNWHRPIDGYMYPQDDLSEGPHTIVRESILDAQPVISVPGDIIARSPVRYDSQRLQNVFKKILL